MLKNVVTIALGLFIASGLGLAADVAYRVVRPYKQEDRIKDLPTFSVSQDYTTDANKLPPLVRLETPSTSFNEQHFTCSGAVISDDYVVTAAHCVGGMVGKLSSDKILVISLGETSVTVEAIPASMNARADYAVIKGDFRQFNKLRVLPYLGSSISRVYGAPILLTCGFPWGSKDACYKAAPVQPYLSYVLMRGLLYPGMSGGPVIEPQSMILVGVNSMMMENGLIAIAPLVGLFETLHIQVVP